MRGVASDTHLINWTATTIRYENTYTRVVVEKANIIVVVVVISYNNYYINVVIILCVFGYNIIINETERTVVDVVV